MIITIDNYTDCTPEEIINHAIDMVSKTPRGLCPADLQWKMSLIGMTKKDFSLLVKRLEEDDRIMLRMSAPDYRRLSGTKRQQMVYITSQKQLAEKSTTIKHHQLHNAAIVLRIIAEHGTIKENTLKKLFKAETGTLYDLKESLIHLITEGKIKINEQPKIGKIKTIYTAT
jgi:hypothetical protein